MKKTLIIALAGIMMFAFTQCGGGGNTNSGSKIAKGSKEYQDNLELYQKIEKSVKDAKTCDELGEAIMSVLLMGLANDKEYAENEKMTEAEQAELEKLGDSFQELFEKQSEKLGCEEGDFKIF